MLEFLSKNKHSEYPQRIFELGNTIIPDSTKETKTRDVRKLSATITNTIIGYEDIASLLDAFMVSLGVDYKLCVTSHPSFIAGRTALVIVSGKEVGHIGEIHPSVLNNWGLEKPVSAFELDIDKILDELIISK